MWNVFILAKTANWLVKWRFQLPTGIHHCDHYVLSYIGNNDQTLKKPTHGILIVEFETEQKNMVNHLFDGLS
jgi:hypothetical protein